jgi:ethanolamine ammonia-lyase small subunit
LICKTSKRVDGFSAPVFIVVEARVAKFDEVSEVFNVTVSEHF